MLTIRSVLKHIVVNLDDYFDIMGVLVACKKVYAIAIGNREISQIIKRKFTLEEKIDTDVNGNPMAFYTVFTATQKKHGHYTVLFPDGDISLECSYFNDLLDGAYRLWIIPGMHHIEHKTFRLGVLHGQEITYTVDGRVLRRTAWINGQKHGQEIIYDYETRRIIKDSVYHEGVLHGKQCQYKNNGVIEEFSNYVHGHIVSKYSFDANGWPMSYIEISPETDKIHGEYHEYYSREELAYKGWQSSSIVINNFNIIEGGHYAIKKRGKFADDLPNGEWYVFNTQGKVVTRETYHNGKLDRRESFVNGTLIVRAESYVNDTLISVVKFDPSTGHMISHTAYDYRSGHIISHLKFWPSTTERPMYYPKKSVQRYYNGKKHGYKLQLHTDGKRVSKLSRYANGIKNGLEVTFYCGADISADEVTKSTCGETTLEMAKTYFTRLCRYQNGKMTGWFFNKYPSGNLKLITHLNESGKPTGLYLKFHDNGAINIVCQYIKSGIIGWYREYHADGSVAILAKYTDESNLEGDYLEYYPSGQLKKRLMYSEGSLVLDDGTELVSYHEDGSVKKKITINDGTVILFDDGKQTTFNDISFFENLLTVRPEMLDFV